MDLKYNKLLKLYKNKKIKMLTVTLQNMLITKNVNKWNKIKLLMTN